jgi:hypothetical protein
MTDQAELFIVTPDGVRDGDAGALRGLVDRRGAAVLAYTERVAAPGLAVDAAAQAFASFRGAVVAAGDPTALDPERTLLRGTRYAAAAVAPVDRPLRARVRGDRPAACAIVPELLVARAERDLGDADGRRLSRHLDRCGACRSVERRFRAGEHAYRDAPDAPPPPQAAVAILQALVDAAPVRLQPAAAVAVAEPAPDADLDLEPVAYDQPTYEFDTLPAEAFDLSPGPRPYEPAPQLEPAPAPAGDVAVRILLPVVIVLVALLVALTVSGVLRA